MTAEFATGEGKDESKEVIHGMKKTDWSQRQQYHPLDLARVLDATLRSLLLQIGQALQSRARLRTVLNSTQAKAAALSSSASSTITSSARSQSVERELHNTISHLPTKDCILGKRKLEEECVKYDLIIKELKHYIAVAKGALEQELGRAKVWEEKERIRSEEERRKKEELRAKASPPQETDQNLVEGAVEAARATAMDLDSEKRSLVNAKTNEEEDDDDVPLAGLVNPSTDDAETKPGQEFQQASKDSKPYEASVRAEGTQQKPKVEGTIDLTDDSPPLKEQALSMTPALLPHSMPQGSSGEAVQNVGSSTSLPTDPATLLASLTGIATSSPADAGSTSDAMSSSTPATSSNMTDNKFPWETFDFSSLGLDFSNNNINNNDTSSSRNEKDNNNTGPGGNVTSTENERGSTDFDSSNLTFLDLTNLASGHSAMTPENSNHNDGLGKGSGTEETTDSLLGDMGNIDFAKLLESFVPSQEEKNG